MINSFFGEAQTIMDRLRWGWPDLDDTDAALGRVAVVGLVGAGKKTLLNSLWGWQALEGPSPDDAVRDFGLFRLVDLPADPLAADTVLFRLEGMDLILYVLDAAAGLRAEDFPWIARLRALGVTLIVVLNKTDLVSADALPGLLAELEGRLSMPVLPLHAADTAAVREHFVPAVLKLCPKLAVPLAAEIAGLRGSVARQIIRQSALMGWLLGLEPGPTADVSMLIGLQLKLIGRLAAIYGRRDRDGRRQEMNLAVLAGLAAREATQALARLAPPAAWLISASLAASSTWVIGQAALAYYEAALPGWAGRLEQWWSGKAQRAAEQTPG